MGSWDPAWGAPCERCHNLSLQGEESHVQLWRLRMPILSVTWHTLDPNFIWSVKPSYKQGNDDQKPFTEWFLIVLMATICFILLIFSLICKIGHLWNRLFPPVPAPKSSIKDFFVIVNSEKTVSSETEIEVISYVEEPGFETLEDSVF